MALQRIFPPVRPMDPAYISKFMTAKKMDKNLVRGFKKALTAYHSKCNRAVAELERSLDSILKKLK
jgi:hypothetical protein